MSLCPPCLTLAKIYDAKVALLEQCSSPLKTIDEAESLGASAAL
jgi:hypothetical protein